MWLQTPNDILYSVGNKRRYFKVVPAAFVQNGQKDSFIILHFDFVSSNCNFTSLSVRCKGIFTYVNLYLHM